MLWSLTSIISSSSVLFPNFVSPPKNPSYLCNCKLGSAMLPFNPSVPLRSLSDGTGIDCSVRGSGEIHVIVGPMFAGKTTALLRRIKSESSNGRKVAMVKSSKDTRYSIDSVVSHDGIKFPCWALPNLSSFKEKFGTDAYDKLDVIGIDEAQFFEDLYEFCSEVADHDGKTVIVAGLDGDYLRRSFGSVLDVIPLADSVTKLTARCELCGKRAFFTLRKTGATETELIGGADVYMPVCRQHYAKGQVGVDNAIARAVSRNCKAKSDGTYLEPPLLV